MYSKVDNWIDLVALDKEILQFWEDQDIFKKLVKKNENGEPWSFIDGPITANNKMGVHHAWGRSLKDAYQRYHAMNGRAQRYQNGFDCQGLWVEVEVEKELGFQTKKDIEAYGIEKFVNQCKERVLKFSKIITEQSKRLAYWMDWDNSYYTMSDENNYSIWSFLKKCHDKGLIYKGNDVMPWCPRCGTGISQHEMQEGYKDVKHISVVVKFPIEGAQNEYFLVWTTTPWTLVANVAVAIHPDLDYSKVKQNDEFYYIVKEQVSLLGKPETWEEVQVLKGKEILDQSLKYRPLFEDVYVHNEKGKSYCTVSWDEISKDDGTGMVHIAPGCGAEDFVLGQENHLDIITPVDEAGNYLQGISWLAGKSVFDVADDIVRYLKENNVLYQKERFEHSYPHCWRCKHELIFRLVDEWYISMDSWREEIKAVTRKINWIPSFGLDQELDWLDNMHDWMISKKRYWGLALPIWECKECNHFEVLGSKDELNSRATEGWSEFEGNSPHRPWVDKVKIECPKCKGKMERIADVGNPWLDAGIVPYSTINYLSDKEYWKKWVPADLVLECFPGQFRNWFYSLLAMSTMMENVHPFKTLVGHALVKDENGEEMHKSKGNAIWFDDAVDKVGADLIRWQYFRHDIASNLNFSFDFINQIRGQFYNTLWNSFAFYINYAMLAEFNPFKVDANVLKRTELDNWILARLKETTAVCRKGFESFQTKTVCFAVEKFIDDLSNWYIRLNRRRFWKSEEDADTTVAFYTLYECLFGLDQLIAPLMPVSAEAIYQKMVVAVNSDAPQSVHLTDFPSVDESEIDRKIIDDVNLIQEINSAALSARQKAKIKTRQPLSKLDIYLDSADHQDALKRLDYILLNDVNVKEIKTHVGADFERKFNIKPNFKTLGIDYKDEMGQIIGQIKKNSDQINETLLKEGKVTLELGGASVELGKKYFIFEEIDPENKSIMDFPGGFCVLDTLITDELKQEGLMREFLRRVQNLRKEIGLDVADRIEVKYTSSSAEIKEMITAFHDYIFSELLCVELKEEPGLSAPHTIAIGGDEVLVDIQKK